jgi:hypothetical protein
VRLAANHFSTAYTHQYNIDGALVAFVFSTPVHSISQAAEVPTSKVCKATISKLMFKDPSIIRVNKKSNDVVFLSYVRKNDGTVWKYKCKLEDERVLWGMDEGRWRNHSNDSNISYYISGNKLKIKENYSDGSGDEKTYNISGL